MRGRVGRAASGRYELRGADIFGSPEDRKNKIDRGALCGRDIADRYRPRGDEARLCRFSRTSEMRNRARAA